MYLTSFDPYGEFRTLEKRMMQPFKHKEKEYFTSSVNIRKSEFHVSEMEEQNPQLLLIV
ncbi:MAG: hypothetical protein P8Y22_01840 [Sulfurimonas sp.]|jgi:hypothetical protein